MKSTTVTPHPVNRETIIEKVKAFPGKKVNVAVSDIDGILRGKMIHLDKFLSSVSDRFGFCDVVFGWDSSDKCYDNTDYTGWHTGYPDTQARLDLSTYRSIPWEDGTPFFLVDLEHPLSTLYDVHHGLANAIMLVHGVRFNAAHCPEVMKRIRHAIDDYDVIEALQKLNSRLNLPSNLRSIGIVEKDIDKLAKLAYEDPCHQCNPRQVTEKDFKELYKRAL